MQIQFFKFRSKLCYFLFTDINDLPQCLKYATARAFADDTTIANPHQSTARFHREVNHDLNNLRNWVLANQLSLNVLKTEYMYFASDYNLSIYIAVIEPFFDYCDVVWGVLNKTPTARFPKLQNRAARIITSKGYDVRSADIRKELRWVDLETMRKKT